VPSIHSQGRRQPAPIPTDIRLGNDPTRLRAGIPRPLPSPGPSPRRGCRLPLHHKRSPAPSPQTPRLPLPRAPPTGRVGPPRGCATHALPRQSALDRGHTVTSASLFAGPRAIPDRSRLPIQQPHPTLPPVYEAPAKSAVPTTPCSRPTLHRPY
jgi:hypothetical protein